MSNPSIPRVIELPSFFPYRLSVLEQVVSEQVAACYKDEYQLMRNDWRVLATLAMKQEETMTATDIGTFTKMEKMQVSRAVQRLKSSELLVSEVNPNDKRASFFRLSGKGIEVYNAVVPKVLAREQQLLACLSASEQATICQLLDKLEAQFQINVSFQND